MVFICKAEAGVGAGTGDQRQRSIWKSDKQLVRIRTCQDTRMLEYILRRCKTYNDNLIYTCQRTKSAFWQTACLTVFSMKLAVKHIITQPQQFTRLLPPPKGSVFPPVAIERILFMKSVLLIGINKFGTLIAKQLHSLGHQVLAVDRDEERINAVLPIVTDAQIGDSTNEAFLRSLGVNNFDVCIVTIGSDFQSSLETTSLLKELGGKLVVSRADRDVQTKFLLRNGADEVINPEKQVAQWAAIRYTSDHILDYISLDSSHAIYEVSVPKEWIGKSIVAIDIRKRYSINILAIRQDGKMNLSIMPDMILNENMTLLVVGERKSMQKCFKI